MPDNQEELHSFERIFHSNYPLLCRRVYRISKDMDAAEDIVQEVFIGFWNRNKLQKIEKPEAYLYRACINKALNYTSSQNRDVRLQQLHTAEQQPEAGNSPQQDMEQEELEQRVQHTIGALPAMCRKVFLLSRYEEMSHKEIAAFLEISPNTVDNHIKKALSILRKALLSLILAPFEFYFIFFL